ncbi:MAG: hypothetical protein PHH28_00135 [Desulfuromonadaceae bacterium]|nr:hypothetical protein [Desulfuromonadaceae bacterium]
MHFSCRKRLNCLRFVAKTVGPTDVGVVAVTTDEMLVVRKCQIIENVKQLTLLRSIA